MGPIEILKGAFSELAKNPVLFLPKMVSVTIYAIPYLFLLEQAKAEMASQAMPVGTFAATLIILALSPLYIMIDSMYPVLVAQI